MGFGYELQEFVIQESDALFFNELAAFFNFLDLSSEDKML
jgi:hypothetical protein